MLRSPYAVSPSLGLGLDHSPRRSPRGGAAGSSQTSGPQGSAREFEPRSAARSVRWRRSAPRSSTPRARPCATRARGTARAARGRRAAVGCRVGCRVGRRAARSGGRFADGGEERVSHRERDGVAILGSHLEDDDGRVGANRRRGGNLVPDGYRADDDRSRVAHGLARGVEERGAERLHLTDLVDDDDGWPAVASPARLVADRERLERRDVDGVSPTSARRWTTTGRRGAPEARGGTRGGRGKRDDVEPDATTAAVGRVANLDGDEPVGDCVIAGRLRERGDRRERGGGLSHAGIPREKHVTRATPSRRGARPNATSEVPRTDLVDK